MKAIKKLDVVFELDVGGSGWWVVTVPEVAGAVTQAKTVAQGLERIREALELVLDADLASTEFRPRYKLPKALLGKLARARQQKAKAETVAAQAAKLSREAVRELTTSAGLTRRDVAVVMGISPQRVQQLLEDGGKA